MLNQVQHDGVVKNREFSMTKFFESNSANKKAPQAFLRSFLSQNILKNQTNLYLFTVVFPVGFESTFLKSFYSVSPSSTKTSTIEES